MQDYEIGWRAISLYIGAPVAELRAADEAGELPNCGDATHPRVCHHQLRVWNRVRYLESLLRQPIDQPLDVPLDVAKPM